MQLPDADDTQGSASISNGGHCTVTVSRLNHEMSEVGDIAEGSFGVVKCYRHDFDGNQYAIKQTKRTICSETDLQQQLQEVYALSSFPCRNTVRYFDGWVEDRTVFLQMEKLDGCVASFARPVAEETLQDMVYQIASALHLLHSRDVVHMDVKPENILVREVSNGTFIFKLCDFGLARPLHGGEAKTGEQFMGLNNDDGDRRYMSPELMKHVDDMVDTPVDIFALGASCVALMGGGLEDETATYSSFFCNLIQSMIDPNPQRRPSAFAVARATLPLSCRGNEGLEALQRRIDQLNNQINDLEGSTTGSASSFESEH